MGDFTLIPGKLNNRHEPVKLGMISDFRDPTIRTLTRAENVDRDNNDFCTRRGGRTQRYAGATHSFFTSPFDKTVGWFVQDSVLKRFNIDYTATTLATLGANLPMAYEKVNSELVASNGVNIGWLRRESFTEFAPTLGQFEEKMPAGQYLGFYNGTLYAASGSVLYASKPWNAEVYDPRYGVFPLPGYIRMLAAVEDGLWLATDQQVAFIRGGGASEFKYTERSDQVPPDGGFSVGYEGDEKSSRRVVRWVSKDGFCRGYAGGSFESLSYPDVALPTGSAGKCFHRVNNGTDQYIAVIRNPEGAESFTPPPLTVTTITVS